MAKHPKRARRDKRLERVAAQIYARWVSSISDVAQRTQLASKVTEVAEVFIEAFDQVLYDGDRQTQVTSACCSAAVRVK